MAYTIKEKLRNGKYVKLEDPGHGWLKVEIKDLLKLGIEGKISDFSYMRGDKAYLEEDADMTVFLNTIGIHTSAEFSAWYPKHIITKHTNKNSRIRGYAIYKNHTLEEKIEIADLRRRMLKYQDWSHRSINKINVASIDDLRFWQKHYNF